MRTRAPRPATALAVLVAAIAVGAAGIAAGGDATDPAENGPQTWTFDTRQRLMPAAELDHFRHASVQGLKIPCTRCHHTSKGADVEAGCGECHGVAWSAEVPDIKSASHRLCIRCHVAHNAKPAGQPAPWKCSGCHKGAAPAR